MRPRFQVIQDLKRRSSQKACLGGGKPTLCKTWHHQHYECHPLPGDGLSLEASKPPPSLESSSYVALINMLSLADDVARLGSTDL